MLKLCDIDPVLTSVTRLTLAELAVTSSEKVLPMSIHVGALATAGRGARVPLAVNRYGG
jgi:hypothetical protein